MKTDMADLTLLDSNILIYAEQAETPYYEAAKSLRDRVLAGEISACISPQVLSEFFAVATNPRRVTAPLTIQEARDQIEKYCESEDLVLIHPGSGIVDRMLSLLEAHPVTGPDIFDLLLVATMLENDVARIYTVNIQDFASFSEIEAFLPPDPESIPEPDVDQPNP